MRAVQATAIEADLVDALVARAASGDEVAFARIVAAHHSHMARVSFIVCRDVELAQEAAHAAWPVAWRKLCTVRDPAKLRPWLLAIAANEARALARRRGRRALREIAVDLLPESTDAPARPIPQRGSLSSTWPMRWPSSIPPTERSSA